MHARPHRSAGRRQDNLLDINLDIDTLWWMVQWANEYLRFKRDAKVARKQAHARYKKWTADTNQKRNAGFSASLKVKGTGDAGDDSLDQSQNE